MIPPRAFAIWFQGADAAPPDIERTLRHNARMAERCGWTFSVYDAADLRAAAEECGVVGRWDAYHRMHQKIDLGRMCLLYVHGGVSTDADQMFIRPFDRLPALDSTVPVFSEMVCKPRSLLCHRIAGAGAPRAINNALMMCPPRSPEMLLVIHRIAARSIVRTSSSFLDVQGTTGPASVGWAVADLLAQGRAISIPASVVEPCSMRASTLAAMLSGDNGGQCTPFPDTVAVHEYRQSWNGDFGVTATHCSFLAVLLACCAAAAWQRATF